MFSGNICQILCVERELGLDLIEATHQSESRTATKAWKLPQLSRDTSWFTRSVPKLIIERHRQSSPPQSSLFCLFGSCYSRWPLATTNVLLATVPESSQRRFRADKREKRIETQHKTKANLENISRGKKFSVYFWSFNAKDRKSLTVSVSANLFFSISLLISSRGSFDLFFALKLFFLHCCIRLHLIGWRILRTKIEDALTRQSEKVFEWIV